MTDATETQAPIALDLDTLTLGEMAAVEEASGSSIDRLLARGKASRIMVAAYVHYRRSGEPRTWSEVAGLRLSDVRSSSSR